MTVQHMMIGNQFQPVPKAFLDSLKFLVLGTLYCLEAFPKLIENVALNSKQPYQFGQAFSPSNVYEINLWLWQFGRNVCDVNTWLWQLCMR